MVAVDLILKYKEGLSRIRDCLLDTNFMACMNGSTDLVQVSEFMGFQEGVFIGEILESMFDSLTEMTKMYDYKKEEIEPAKTEVLQLVKYLEKHFPTKDDQISAELYALLVSTRFCVTKSQIAFEREKEFKRLPTTNPFATVT